MVANRIMRLVLYSLALFLCHLLSFFILVVLVFIQFILSLPFCPLQPSPFTLPCPSSIPLPSSSSSRTVTSSHSLHYIRHFFPCRLFLSILPFFLPLSLSLSLSLSSSLLLPFSSLTSLSSLSFRLTLFSHPLCRCSYSPSFPFPSSHFSLLTLNPILFFVCSLSFSILLLHNPLSCLYSLLSLPPLTFVLIVRPRLSCTPCLGKISPFPSFIHSTLPPSYSHSYSLDSPSFSVYSFIHSFILSLIQRFPHLLALYRTLGSTASFPFVEPTPVTTNTKNTRTFYRQTTNQTSAFFYLYYFLLTCCSDKTRHLTTNNKNNIHLLGLQFDSHNKVQLVVVVVVGGSLFFFPFFPLLVCSLPIPLERCTPHPGRMPLSHSHEWGK
ncbi:hypothetical protein K457DRAFT_544344 [Linnemannia elongata AG-77]|uniref:Uncharacterized protein n=1 Tax=Linnemannia elongata AG-77 TaxID=1314771 RepID=A0A197JW89_9FUNG|nr:hypothetical protein K457DRAFT_544344 [Linnemannia elongata AG-77]